MAIQQNDESEGIGLEATDHFPYSDSECRLLIIDTLDWLVREIHAHDAFVAPESDGPELLRAGPWQPHRFGPGIERRGNHATVDAGRADRHPTCLFAHAPKLAPRGRPRVRPAETDRDTR